MRDVARAALVLLEAPDDVVRGEAFNVGSDEQNYLVRELAEVLAEVSGCEIEIACRGVGGPALLPRRLLEARAHLPEPRARVERASEGRASSSMRTGRSG